MVSQEYCEALLEQINDLIEKDWPDAFDDFMDASDDVDTAAEDVARSGTDIGIDFLEGDYGDAAQAGRDYFINQRRLERAGRNLERAQRKTDRLIREIEERTKQWCDECGDPPEDEEEDEDEEEEEEPRRSRRPGPVEEIEFSDDEAEVITVSTVEFSDDEVEPID